MPMMEASSKGTIPGTTALGRVRQALTFRRGTVKQEQGTKQREEDRWDLEQVGMWVCEPEGVEMLIESVRHADAGGGMRDCPRTTALSLLPVSDFLLAISVCLTQSVCLAHPQAHEASLREVAALLAKPDNLGRLGKIQTEYEAQRSAVQVIFLRGGTDSCHSIKLLQPTHMLISQVQISLLTGRQAEEARAGIDMLARCRDNVKQVCHRLWLSVFLDICLSENAVHKYPFCP